MQWIALLLAAARVPLAARYFATPELHASQILLAVQFSWTAILFPVLCRTWRMGLATLAAGWVMLVLAAALSAWLLTDVFPAVAYFGLWVLGLAIWNRALEPDWLRMMGSSLIAAFTIGGPITWYLGLDLGQGASEPATWRFGPLLGLLQHPTSPPAANWIILSLMVLSAVSAAALIRFLARPTWPH